MRMLFTSFPGYGHVSPMLPLARAAQRAGHEVLISTGPDLCPWIETLGFAATPSGLSNADATARYRAQFPQSDALPAEQRMVLVIPNLFVNISARARATDLLPLVREWKPDLMVHDVAEQAAPLVAALTGTPRVVHGLGFPPPPGWVELLASALDALYAEWGIDHGSAVAMDALYLDITPPSWQPDGRPVFATVQPLRPQPVEPAPEDRLPERIEALTGEGIVYVTLGTVFNDRPDLIETLLSSVRDEPFNVVVTLGPGADVARFGPQPDHIYLEQFVSQALVLPHCRAMISHAGAGTTLGGLYHGVPQVLLPQGGDQFGIAELCARAGAAIVVRPEEITTDAIRTALQRLLSQPEYGERARQVQAEIAAMPPADDVMKRLERYEE